MTALTMTPETAYAGFDRATSRWGRVTMTAGLVFSLLGPGYLLFFSGLDISWSTVITAYLAVAATFAILALVEPITYYPVLGPAAMYQAFMIGNIANKLLPAAIVAQASIGAKPGTRRAELSAVMAICGAAVVHITSLLVLVGIFGTWLVSAIPESITEVARLYIFPSIIGAVFVQLAVYVRQPRITLIALAMGALVQLALVPALGPAFGNFATAVVVLSTMALAWYLRDRRPTAAGGSSSGSPDGPAAAPAPRSAPDTH